MHPSKTFDSLATSATPISDPAIRRALDLLGGEPLEGSGFEDESPSVDFQFDWNMAKEESEGGSR